jgi:hypothetical protein
VYSGLGVAGLFLVEGEVAAAYARTPQGQRELARAKNEGHYLYNRSKEVILRPKFAGGVLGVGAYRSQHMHLWTTTNMLPVNVAVLGTLGYTVYTHWDLDVFTKKNVSIATIGLITWFSAQGWAVERYIQEHHH